MLRKSYLGVFASICSICFILGITMEVFGLSHIACWFIVGAAIMGWLLVFPASIARLHKSKTATHNLLIFLSAVVISVLLVFVTISLSYYGLFQKELLSYFELVFYPSTLLYALLELTIDYFNKVKNLQISNDVFDK